MNREILFKAKRKDNGEWVEGYYVYDYCKNIHLILRNELSTCLNAGSKPNREDWTLEPYEIDPDTICQYTGLTDKNGNKIWGNDILKLPGEDGYFTCEWEGDTARFVFNGDGLTVDFDNYYGYECEVIGNVFDNAELLEVE